jgi:hypothetical protein
LNEPNDDSNKNDDNATLLLEGGDDEHLDLEIKLATEADESLKPMEDKDPFEFIKKNQYVNEGRSCLGNFVGYIDFYDRYYSRKFSLIDNKICNLIFCSFAWLFNRKAVLL